MTDFEELLSTPMRWPKEGDRAFKASGTQLDAYLWARGTQRRHTVAESYKLAADVLVERALQDRVDRDYLVYAILFSYRHFIELTLKNIIASYSTPIWNEHRLEPLWQAYEEILVRHDAVGEDESTWVVKAILHEFAALDPRSFSNRYPVDTAGKEIPHAFEWVDLVNLRDVIEGVANYFGGSDDYIDAKVRA